MADSDNSSTNDAAPPPETPYEDRRQQNTELRSHIGEQTILSTEERRSILMRYFQGLLGLNPIDRRKQKDLRKVLGESRILEEQERKTVLSSIRAVVAKFFAVGVRNEQKPTHVEKLGKPQARSFLDRIGRGR